MPKKMNFAAKYFLLPIVVLIGHGGGGVECRDRSNEIFNWQTGPWGVCWSEKDCGAGVMERNVWCGDSLGRRLPYHLCQEENKPSSSKACYKACEGQWHTGLWGPCEVNRINGRLHKENAEGRLCLGTRVRAIACRSEIDTPYPPKCPDPPPPSNVSCYTMCPQDCVIGPWSSWTNCTNCQPSKYRTRQILVAPFRGGIPCPNLSQSKPCHAGCIDKNPVVDTSDAFFKATASESQPSTEKPKLRVSEWGACKEVEPFSGQKDSDETTKSARQLLDKETRVEIEVRDAMTLMGRYLKELPESIAGSELANLEYESPYPKMGKQKRNVTCIDESGNEVKIQRCKHAPNSTLVQERSCVMPVDCKVTEWSQWKTVVEGCVAPNGQVVREIKERKRKALALQKGRGNPCPHLFERHTSPEPSLLPCNTSYKWLASSWGACLSTVGPIDEVKCGGGVQKREIICVHTKTLIPVQDKHCLHVEPPPRYERCEVGCERDCVVGPWSFWSPCQTEECPSILLVGAKGFRRRRRQIVVEASAEGRECPPLEEQIECEEPKCHQWIIGPWSECQLLDTSERCGDGALKRNVTCADVFGVLSPTDRCLIELGSISEREPCHVPCPYDCVLSAWSSWTPCSRPCSDKVTVGYTHRNASIIAPPGTGGKDCPPPDELTQVKTCREEPCGGIAWIPDDWSRCTPDEGELCGKGHQIRGLHCVNLATNEKTSSFRCAGLSPPKVKRSCVVPCEVGCLLSNWSQWSTCQLPETCPKDEEMIKSVQKRWRKVLSNSHPSNESVCGPLEEKRACAIATDVCKPAQWHLGSWSSCVLPPGVNCGTGYRIRAVDCINGSGQATNPSQCLMGNKIVPETSEECFVSCKTSCIVSSWSQWTECPFDRLCVGKNMERKRQLLSGTQYNPLCSNIKLKEVEPCPCQIFYSEASSDWSQCILGLVSDILRTLSKNEYENRQLNSEFDPPFGSEIQEDQNNICGVGNRYRSVKCLRKDNILSDSRYCGHTGIEWEPCMLECPKDCLVGPWGSWSSCNASCGAGIQYRSRQVTQRSLWSGRTCPEREQSRACWGPCNTEWIEDGWSDCLLEEKGDCGVGTQERSVRCVETLPSGVKEVVPDSKCSVRHKPPSKKICRIYCPGECVVSEWSKWSICPSGCPLTANRVRKSHIIRSPSGNITTCPHLLEEETCLTDVSCWTYSWTLGNWTSCVTLGQSSCGEGVRNRPISCVRSDGIFVDESFCLHDVRPSPQEKWCYVDCPIDCIVTDWTAWDSSRCSCGDNAGYMKRERFILVNPSESGRSCPRNRQETLPCPSIPCYTWERSAWSECDLQGGACGHGKMRREVQCIGTGGTLATRDKCLSLIHIGGHTWPYLAHALDLNTEDGCYVPCEGDCELTEWSPWSHCHRDCQRNHKEGIQTRSRAILTNGSSRPCPGSLWENRPCISGPCLTFSWQVNGGKVSCVRSDGLIVTGGCGDAPRPCFPKCNVPGSVCSPVGVCVCEEGYRAHYSESSGYHLTKCHPNFNFSLSRSLPLSQATYLPQGINGWMFAMIGIGSVFVVFVVISVYMMCKSQSNEQVSTSLTRNRHTTLSIPNSAQTT